MKNGFYGYFAVAAGFCIAMVTWGIGFSFGVFFKPMSTELDWTRAATSGAFSLNMILYGLGVVVAGRLTDRFGPRPVITVCAFILTLGYILMSRISALWGLYVFYGALVGIGQSASFVPAVSTVARWFTKGRGIMTGLVITGLGLGILIFPPLITHLISDYGWRTTYLIMGAIVFVVYIVAAQVFKRSTNKLGKSDKSVTEEPSSTPTIGEFSFQAAMRTRQFWTLLTLFLLYGIGQQAIMVHIVPYATDVGLSATVAATIMIVIGGLSMVGMMATGGIADRSGGKRPLLILLILLTGVLFALPGARHLWVFYLLGAIFGGAFGGMTTLQPTSVTELFGLRVHATILGVVIFSVVIGNALGVFIAGLMFDRTGGYVSAFFLCGGLSAVSFLLTLTLKPIKSSASGVTSAV